MSEQTESGGVFGNLPRSRPGTRSPLREPDAAAAQRATPDEPEASETQSSAAAERQDRPHERERAPEREPAAPDEQGSGGLEDLAWAGIAAAAEAATIGVRLASRAMEAVKDAGKRT